MIVTIDGPAGAGKSSTARALAQRLGFAYLDTGAMYRAVALAALRGGCDLHDGAQLETLIAGLQLEMQPGRVLLNGADVAGLIRTPEVNDASSVVAKNPLVRRHLVQLQRRIADGRAIVCEGRDQGTVVFPQAPCKFFLTATPEERAQRRYRELTARGVQITWAQVLQEQSERDQRDAARDVAPMVPAQDAIILDSTQLDQEAVVARMEQEVQRCRSTLATSGTNASLSSAT